MYQLESSLDLSVFWSCQAQGYLFYHIYGSIIVKIHGYDSSLHIFPVVTTAFQFQACAPTNHANVNTLWLSFSFTLFEQIYSIRWSQNKVFFP